MSQKLPVDDFKCFEETSQFNEYFIKFYNEDSGIGDSIPADAQYPEKLYDSLRLKKMCEKNLEKIIFSLVFVFHFQGKIIFFELSFKRKCKKAPSVRKCIFLRKYEIFVYDSCKFSM